MGKETIYRCDKLGCMLTRPKDSENNHWFIVSSAEIPEITISIFPFTQKFLSEESDKIFCGEAHALEYIGTQLPKLYPEPTLCELCEHGNKAEDYCEACGY